MENWEAYYLYDEEAIKLSSFLDISIEDFMSLEDAAWSLLSDEIDYGY
jgi:hypothetical protein